MRFTELIGRLRKNEVQACVESRQRLQMRLFSKDGSRNSVCVIVTPTKDLA